MSHFIAFYQCNKCDKTVCGLISNTMLTIMNENELSIFNPQRDEITQELKVFCPDCKPIGNFGRIETMCQICHDKIELFYQPEIITVVKAQHLGGGEMTIGAKRLLVQYEYIAFCSVDCLQVKYPNETIEPTFMKFKVNQGG